MAITIGLHENSHFMWTNWRRERYFNKLTDTAECIQYSEEMDSCQESVWGASAVIHKIHENREPDARALTFSQARTIVYFLILHRKIE